MAIAYKCDRCGKYFDKKNDDKPGYYTVLKTVEVKGSPCCCSKEIHLCLSCQSGLNDFMNKLTFSSYEVETKIAVHGQSDRQFKLGETIKYSPPEIGRILRGESGREE